MATASCAISNIDPSSAMQGAQVNVAPSQMTLDDIEKAVAELPADELAQFRIWFEEFEVAHFDQKIERDAETGRLDRLAEEALADFRGGRAREL